MERFDAAWATASGVEGWLAEEQARALHEAAQQVPVGTTVVEVGSHHGKSTIVLASAVGPGVRVVAIDPFDDPAWGGGPAALARFEANLDAAGVRGGVVLDRRRSVEAAADWSGGPIGLLYLDGAHDLSSVLADLDAWLPKLAVGGRLYVHDAFSLAGTTVGVLRRTLFNASMHYLGSVRSLAMFEHGRRSRVGVLTDSARLVARLEYFGRNLMIRQALRRGWPRAAERLGHHGEPVTF